MKLKIDIFSYFKCTALLIRLSSVEGSVKSLKMYLLRNIWMFPYQFSLAPAFSIRDLWGPRHMISRIYNSEFWINTYQLSLLACIQSRWLRNYCRYSTWNESKAWRILIRISHGKNRGIWYDSDSGLVSNPKKLRFVQYLWTKYI